MNLKLSFIILTAGLLSFSGSSVCHAQSKEVWPAVTKEMKPWTRWWWLGNAVDQEGLTFRLEEMNKAGFGGVEITPIYGTKGFESKFIDFLSPQWMKMLNHTISEGNRLGMGVDMNTGTGWPFGGPEVSVENAASKVILQTYSLDSGEKLKEPVVVNEKKQKDVAVLQVLMAFSNSGDRINITDKVDNNGNLNWTAPRGKWKLIAAFNGKSFQQVKRAAPGGQGPVMDHFSAKAVDSYLNKFTQAFQSSSSPVPHNFFNDSYEVYGADWSKNFFDEFANYRGYRLENYLLEFMGEGDADIVSRVVSDYRETISDMLLHNFTLNWTGWAHKMGSQTRNQAHGSPGNLIDLYGTVDVPECESFGSTYFDIPGLRWDGREGSNSLESNYLMMKFSSSAAHISGHPLSSSETFTWLTEHFKTALSQCKPQVDMMLLTGINHVVYHGTPYSPKDAPWPGWLFYASVDFSSYNTIWKDIRPMNEYIARCQSFLQNGSPDNDFLVYWPVYDTWYNIKGKPFYAFTIGQTLNEWLVPTSFYRTASKLHEKGYGFDYISDHFLADAKVENGRVKTQGASYKVLVVPSCRLMPVETMKKIISLINEGAKVAFVDNFAQDVPGLHNFDARRQQLISLVLSFPEHSFVNMGKVTKMGKGTLITGSNIDKLVDLCGVKRETVVDDGIQYIRRSNPEGFHYFFANLQSKALDGWVTLGVDAVSAQIFDPLTGKTGLAGLRKKKKETEVYLQLKPGQSLILKTYSSKKLKGEYWNYIETAGTPVELEGKWSFSFKGGQPKIQGKFEMNELKSWTELNTPEAKNFAGTGRYILKFNLPETKTADWLLDLGKVCESARVLLNGQKVDTLWSLPFQERVGKFLKPGENLLQVDVTNLPANRIADYDRRGIQWRIFYEINFVNPAYKPFDASGWDPMPSGLLGPVKLIPIKSKF